MKLLFLSSAFSFGFSETVVDHARDMEEHKKIEPHREPKFYPGPQPETSWPLEEEKPEFWREKTRDEIHRALNKKRLEKKAKNVILFLGDGMGIPTITAGRILINGESYVTHMENLDFSGMVKTYNVDFQTPDSAATATAYLTGVKGRYYTAGLDAGAVLGDCDGSFGHEVESVFEKAKKSGKEVGFVTTAYVNHASPSGLYAKVPYRFWYSDGDMVECLDCKEGETCENCDSCTCEKPDSNKNCKDIAEQLFDASDDISVIMGGGRQFFKPKPDGNRFDGRDFLGEWESREDTKMAFTADDMWSYVNSGMKEDKLVGIFTESHLDYEIDRRQSSQLSAEQPHLANMTEVAIRRLETSEEGYYLFIEGGRIDLAHHASEAIRALNEYAAFDEAIGKALEMVDLSETLVMVTADHSHVFSFGSSGERGANVFGLGTQHVGYDEDEAFILGYANGPGFRTYTNSSGKCDREKPSASEDKWGNPDENTDFAYPSSSYTPSESHGGEDVALFAQGPMAHLVSGVSEQTFVAHLAEFALCIGDYTEETHCTALSGTSATNISYFFSVLLFAFYLS